MQHTLDSRRSAQCQDPEERRRLAFALAMREGVSARLSKLRHRVMADLHRQWAKIITSILH